MCNDSVDILVSQGLEAIAGMVRLVPQERGKRIVVDFVGKPVPQLVQRTVEQVPVRQILEEAVVVMDVVPRCMVDVQVSQNRDAGKNGRDNEMDEWSEGAIKSCNAGNDSKRIRSFLRGSLELTSTGTARLGDIIVPAVMEEIVVVAQDENMIPQERVQQRTVEYVSAPQFRKEAFGVVLAPTARGQHRIGEQIVEWERFVDVSVPKH